MTGPPEVQKRPPSCVTSAAGGQKRDSAASQLTGGNQGMFPVWVKRARNAWPTWLGERWLMDLRRAAP